MHSRQLLKTRQVMYYVTSLCGLSSWGFSSRCPCFQGKKKNHRLGDPRARPRRSAREKWSCDRQQDWLLHSLS
jgi:hypothetical protein